MESQNPQKHSNNNNVNLQIQNQVINNNVNSHQNLQEHLHKKNNDLNQNVQNNLNNLNLSNNKNRPSSQQQSSAQNRDILLNHPTQENQPFLNYYPLNHFNYYQRQNSQITQNVQNPDQLKLFIKKADQINFDNYKKLQQQKRVTQFKKMERSSGSLYKIDREVSLANIKKDYVPHPRQRQIKRVYIGSNNKNKNTSKKKVFHYPKRFQKKQLLSKFVQTSRKLVQLSQLDYLQPTHQQVLQTERNYRYSDSHTITLDPIKKSLPVEIKNKNLNKIKLNSIQPDSQQEGTIPKKKILNLKRNYNTLSNNNEMSAATFYLQSMSKKNHDFQQEIKKYGRRSLLSQYNQQVVFKQSNNRTFSNLGLAIQKDDFKFDDKQTSVGGPHTFIDKNTINNIQTKKKTPINKDSQQIKIARKTSPSNFLSLKQSSNQKQIKIQNPINSQNNIFSVQNNDDTMLSVYAEKSSRVKKTEQSQYFQNSQKFGIKNTFNFGSTFHQSDNTYKNNNKIMNQTSIQVPQIPQLSIGNMKDNSSRVVSVHPIKNDFGDRQLQWIAKQFRPKSNLITKISTLNFQIKKYKNGVYFGQLNQQGQKNGKGVIFYYNGRIYEGGFIQDMKQGKGYECFPDGSYYNGDFKSGIKQGKGTFAWPNGQTYDGQWLKGKKNGSGMWKSLKGQSYIGEWNNGKVQGFGVYIMGNGDRYQGQFVNSLKHGLGTQRFGIGDTYVGSYRKNRPNGQGQYFWVNGDYYKGHFSNGLRHGQGYFKDQQTGNTYKGQFQNDKFCGLGQMSYAQSQQTYIGNFQNSIRHGYGELYQQGQLIWKGYWINDNRVDQNGTPIIQQQLERQQSMPKNISNKNKKNTNININTYLNKSLSPRAKQKSNSKTPRKLNSRSPTDNKNFMRQCGCSKKH